MKAIVITDFGEPDVFAKRELERPIPKPDELLVKVYATSVNPADCGIRRGVFGQSLSLPAILGYDVSGVVEAKGELVHNFAVGDEVYYGITLFSGPGANAEYHVASAATVARKPSNLTHPQAASVPVAGGTAWAALIDRGALQVGETVLIHGAAGGVGTFAVQIARAAGAYVFATCGGYDRELVESLGADKVIDYRNQDFVEIINRDTNGAGVDLSFDGVGGEVLAQSLAVTKVSGRAVTITGIGGNLNLAINRNITVHFVHLDDARPKLEAMKTLIERGLIQPVVGTTLPVTQVAQAHQKLEQGGEGTYGKIVLEVAGQL